MQASDAGHLTRHSKRWAETLLIETYTYQRSAAPEALLFEVGNSSFECHESPQDPTGTTVGPSAGEHLDWSLSPATTEGSWQGRPRTSTRRSPSGRCAPNHEVIWII